MINENFATQGYCFYTNNMHGQMRASTTYKVNFSNSFEDRMQGAVITNSQITEFYEPGEAVPLANSVSVTNDNYFEGPSDNTWVPGSEMEVTHESRFLLDENNNVSVEGDASVGLALGFAVIPYLSAFPSFTATKSGIYMNTSSKVINYPAIQKGTISFSEGVAHKSENELFSSKTGKPIVTKTYDAYRPHNVSSVSDLLDLNFSNDHQGKYTSHSVPAVFAYSGMGQKVHNENQIISSEDVEINLLSDTDSGTLTFELEENGDPAEMCELLSSFGGGDLIQVRTESGFLNPYNLFHIESVNGNVIDLVPLSYTSGSTTSHSDVRIKIIRSGRTNQLNQSVSSFTTYTGSDAPEWVSTPMTSLTERENFAAQLNAALTSDLIIDGEAIMTSVPLNAYGASCSAWNDDVDIRFTDGLMEVFTPEDLTTTIIQDHPMVDALNDYLLDYYRYDLDYTATNNPGVSCSLDFNSISGYELDYKDALDTDVIAMRAAQDLDLAEIFDHVNGQTLAISDVMTDDGVALGYTETFLEVPANNRENLRVVLVDNSGNVFGVRAKCNNNLTYAELCHGCGFQGDYDNFHCEKWSNQGIGDIGKFRENNNTGQLYYEYTYSFNGQTNNGKCNTDITFYDESGTPEIVHCEQQFSKDGSFVVDPITGLLEFVFDDYPCSKVPIECVNFCNEDTPTLALTQVVSSSAVTMKSNWDFDPEEFYLADEGLNDYECGKKGQYRQLSSFSFDTDVSGFDSDNLADVRTYNSGMYDLEVFNYEHPASNSSKWLEMNRVLSYSPYGHAEDEQNILGIHSTALFGYNQELPTAIAQNASKGSVIFESFERLYSFDGGQYFENGYECLHPANVVTDAHSGNNAYQLINGDNTVKPVVVTPDLLSEGLTFKVWVKSDRVDNLENSFILRMNEGQISTEGSCKIIAQVGQWRLIVANISSYQLASFGLNQSVDLTLNYDAPTYENASDLPIIDDLRVQPTGAQMITYVYNSEDLRLASSFDDQHFGLFYQYNGEGKLVRKLKETERGLKSIDERQYNTPLKDIRTSTPVSN